MPIKKILNLVVVAPQALKEVIVIVLLEVDLGDLLVEVVVLVVVDHQEVVNYKLLGQA